MYESPKQLKDLQFWMAWARPSSVYNYKFNSYILEFPKDQTVTSGDVAEKLIEQYGEDRFDQIKVTPLDISENKWDDFAVVPAELKKI